MRHGGLSVTRRPPIDIVMLFNHDYIGLSSPGKEAPLLHAECA
jgi:hypothetical protein